MMSDENPDCVEGFPPDIDSIVTSYDATDWNELKRRTFEDPVIQKILNGRIAERGLSVIFERKERDKQ